MNYKTIFSPILLTLSALFAFSSCTPRAAAPANEKPKYLWFDAEANFQRFASQDSIRYYLDLTKKTGFNHIVVDVRPIIGDVLYKSDFMTPLTEVRGPKVERNWDYLQFFLDEARKRDLKVTVSTAIFPAGKPSTKQGPAYHDPQFAGRTCLEYLPSGKFLDIKDDPTKVAAFLNPVLKENQDYALRFVEELLTKYKFDGYALDYCRFPDRASDFSDATRSAFEEFLGQEVKNWPADVFSFDKEGHEVAGIHYKKWWEFRAKTIRNFIARVRNSIDRLQPDVDLEYWAASWLHAIYGNGQNWGSSRAKFHEAYLDTWATPEYCEAGFADLLDTFITGTYLEKVRGMEDPESIEYGLARSNRDVMGDCRVFGSLYAQNHLDQFDDAVYLCLTRTEGLMVFDIVQVINYNLWDSIKRGIDRAESEAAEGQDKH